MKGWKPPQTGIEIIHGLPGSGKSYFAVRRLVQVITKLRRPVYTNLPLKRRVLQYYLAQEGGSALAKYIQPLDRDHFERFLGRNAEFAGFRDLRRLEAERAGVSYADGDTESEFVKLFGPHVVAGEKANWIPAAAVVIIDEAHRWYDARDLRTESKNLLLYTSMHRHHLHWIWALTQDPMQVSLSFRRNCHVYWKCQEANRLPFLFGLKLPIAAFAYASFESKGTEGIAEKASSRELEIPFFTSGLTWRFYASFSHAGNVRRLKRKLEASQREVEMSGEISKVSASSIGPVVPGVVEPERLYVMVDADGNLTTPDRQQVAPVQVPGVAPAGPSVQVNVNNNAPAVVKRRRKHSIWKTVGTMGAVGVGLVAIIAGVGGAGCHYARGLQKPEPAVVKPVVQTGPVSPLLKSGEPATRQSSGAPAAFGGRLSAVGPDFVVVDSRLVQVGSWYADVLLVRSNPDEEISTWFHPFSGATYLWSVGGGAVRGGLPDGASPATESPRPKALGDSAGATTRPAVPTPSGAGGISGGVGGPSSSGPGGPIQLGGRSASR